MKNSIVALLAFSSFHASAACFSTDDSGQVIFAKPTDETRSIQFVERFARARIGHGKFSLYASAPQLLAKESEATGGRAILVTEASEIDGDAGDHWFYNRHKIAFALDPVTCAPVGTPLDLGRLDPE